MELQQPDQPANSTVYHVDPHELRMHPANEQIYGRLAEENPEYIVALKASIKASGVLEPLLVAEGYILSGHLRCSIALELGLATVPVIDSPLTDPDEIEETIIIANYSRFKPKFERKERFERELPICYTTQAILPQIGLHIVSYVIQYNSLLSYHIKGTSFIPTAANNFCCSLDIFDRLRNAFPCVSNKTVSIADNCSNAFRAVNGICCFSNASVYNRSRVKANTQIKTCPKTRGSLQCRIGRKWSGSFKWRKASSTIHQERYPRTISSAFKVVESDFKMRMPSVRRAWRIASRFKV
jgi:hypothetical protein